MPSKLLVSCFLVLYSSISVGAVIHNEAVDGDLAFIRYVYQDDWMHFDLSIGSNVFQGNVVGYDGYYGGSGETSKDKDAFYFTVPIGMTVTQIELSYSASVTPSGGFLNDGYSLYSADDWTPGFKNYTRPSIGSYWIEYILGGSDALNLFAPNLPLGSGTYLIGNLSHTIRLGTNDIEYEYAIDYEYSFSVSEVPIPAVSWLFPAGMIAGFGVMRRWSKSSEARSVSKKKVFPAI